jgi:hypothetical protein
MEKRQFEQLQTNWSKPNQMPEAASQFPVRMKVVIVKSSDKSHRINVLGVFNY